MAMGRMTVVALVAALLAALTGCSIRTAGAPQGSLSLKATFDDVQGLVVGHSVQMSDVKIGTVTKVELDPRTYKTTATLSIVDGHRIPQGVTAEIKVTSLLGENYVDIILPPGGSMDRGPFLASGASVANTSVQPAFEQVVGQAGPLLQALAGNDVATIVNTGAAALDGNGERINVTIAKSGDLLKVFTAQRAELVRSVDQFAKLGRSLAKGDDQLSKAPGELQRTTALLDDNKHKILKTVQKLTRMARELNDKVLEGRVLRLRELLNDLDPVLSELGNNRTRLTKLVDGLVQFSAKIPKATYDGQLLLYPLVKVVWPDGTPLLPDSVTGGAAQAGSKSKTKAGKERQGPKLPPGLEGALPDLNDLLEPR
ncbi:MlaD family protein [Spirillospora sp. NPDC029432]|uniref:MlaD family protein n=1 Tax=Spirillospora sp. NPDC029432 TaxID=3154599 RepID=UPI003455F884